MGMMNARFWVQLFVGTIFTMLCIYGVKKMSQKYEIPGLKQLSEGV